MRKLLCTIAGLVWVLAFVSCQGTEESQQTIMPAGVTFHMDGGQGPEGFFSVQGKTNLPAGRRILLTVHAAPDYKCDLSESALCVIQDDGTFIHRTLFAYPVSYLVQAQYCKAGNPENAEWFGLSLKERALPDQVTLQMEADGFYKLVMDAVPFRVGTVEQEEELIAGYREALIETFERIEYDNKQLQRISASRTEAVNGYLSWERIRLEKARKYGVDSPDVNSFYSELDLRLRKAWYKLDRVALFHLAQAVGNQKEQERNASGKRGFERDMKKLQGEIQHLREIMQ